MARSLRALADRTRIVPVAALGLLLLIAAPASWAADPYQAAMQAVKGGRYADALSGFEALAKKGDARGDNGLGVLYSRGLGVSRDPKRAFHLFSLAAAKGLRAAENNLGKMYRAGTGVQQDDTKALLWFKRAADQGDADAQNNLGTMYANGIGVRRDYEEALRWFRSAAEQGDANAQANVGHLYRTGDGVKRDYVQAYAWYGVAAAGGLTMGPQLRDSLLPLLSSDELRAARRLARDLYLKYGQH